MHANKKIIYVSHDAHFHGAQPLYILLKPLKKTFITPSQLFLLEPVF